MILVKSYELLKRDYDKQLELLQKMIRLNSELQNENRKLKESLNKIYIASSRGIQ